MNAGMRASSVLRRGFGDFLSPYAHITDRHDPSMKGKPNAIMTKADSFSVNGIIAVGAGEVVDGKKHLTPR